ncbi:RNA-dependent ATPase rok1 [Dispira simplex]|nr:RNA-dependent ATPase rok1 [Dispira simplex]
MDFFKTLGAGAQFNRQKFRRDIEIFEKTDREKRTGGPTNLDKSEVLPELDFFNQRVNFTGSKTNLPAVSTESKAEDTTAEESSGANLEDGSSSETDEPFETIEAAGWFRNKHRIRIYGDKSIQPVKTFNMMFNQWTFRPVVRRNFESIGFRHPTPIQMQAIPITMASRDLVACAPTGSGKTLAFLLPILQALDRPSKVGFRAVVVTPTRELGRQIFGTLEKLVAGTKLRVCFLAKLGGSVLGNANNRKKYDILVTTPLRLVHEIQHENIDLSTVQHLVLDEADQLLELGFLEQMDTIIAACTHPHIRKSLFSATISSNVEELATSIMRDPIRVVVGIKNAATEDIDQKLVYVGQEEGKLVEVRQMVHRGIRPPVLIFVQSIERAKELFHELIYDGINVDVIHSERTKAQRDSIITNFRSGKIWVLIATELMSRGIDFKGVNLVVNYDFPQTIQSYIHRIGRTGRAGRKGEAVTFFTKDDLTYLKSIVNVMRSSGCEVPEWMLQVKPPSKGEKSKLKRKPISRDIITTNPYQKRIKLQEERRKEKVKAQSKSKTLSGKSGPIADVKSKNRLKKAPQSSLTLDDGDS